MLKPFIIHLVFTKEIIHMIICVLDQFKKRVLIIVFSMLIGQIKKYEPRLKWMVFYHSIGLNKEAQVVKVLH